MPDLFEPEFELIFVRKRATGISFSKITPDLFDDRVAIDQPATDIQLSCIDFANQMTLHDAAIKLKHFPRY